MKAWKSYPVGLGHHPARSLVVPFGAIGPEWHRWGPFLGAICSPLFARGRSVRRIAAHSLGMTDRNNPPSSVIAARADTCMDELLRLSVDLASLTERLHAVTAEMGRLRAQAQFVAEGGTDPNGPASMTMSAAAAYMGIGRTTLYEEVRAGRLAPILVGSRQRLTRDACDAWVRAREGR